jgi:hypothetical protein
MKLCERIIEHRLRGVINITKNQFDYMVGRSTMKAIFLIKQLIERCREEKKKLHMLLIDLDKAYDKVHRNVMWWVLQKYITLIKNMYNNIVTSVLTSDRDTYNFSTNIGLHQRSALCSYLFALVKHEVTSDIQGGILSCMLIVDNVVLVYESKIMVYTNVGKHQKVEIEKIKAEQY